MVGDSFHLAIDMVRTRLETAYWIRVKTPDRYDNTRYHDEVHADFHRTENQYLHKYKGINIFVFDSRLNKLGRQQWR